MIKFARITLFIAAVILSACVNNTVKTNTTEQVADSIADQIIKTHILDQRTNVFEVKVEVLEESKEILVLGQSTDTVALKYFLKELATTKPQYQLKNKVRQLPDTVIGKNSWAMVNLSVAPMRAEPKFSSEMVSQAIMGTPIRLLDKKGEWFHIQTPDNYIGWMNETGFVTLTSEELKEWQNSKQRVVINAVTSAVYEDPSVLSTVISDLVLGSIVVSHDETRPFFFTPVILPDGRRGYVKYDDCKPLRYWKKKTEPSRVTGRKITTVAKSLLGTPYLWGGTSSKGMDCSGFTKNVFFMNGFVLERDASQQFKYGHAKDVNNSSDWKPGDLLFFGESEDKVSHVGIYLGNDKFIHDAGMVKINSLNPKDSDYSEKRASSLIGVREVLNLEKGNPITSVHNPNSWYFQNSYKSNAEEDNAFRLGRAR